MNVTTILAIAVTILAIAVIYLLISFFRLRDEVTEGKYLVSEKSEDGGFTIKNSKGKIIFEL